MFFLNVEGTNYTRLDSSVKQLLAFFTHTAFSRHLFHLSLLTTKPMYYCVHDITYYWHTKPFNVQGAEPDGSVCSMQGETACLAFSRILYLQSSFVPFFLLITKITTAKIGSIPLRQYPSY
jgi:hypothetical protein